VGVLELKLSFASIKEAACSSRGSPALSVEREQIGKRLLGPVLGKDVAVETTLAPNLLAVEADPGQIEQVLLKLAVNARDAMPNGGLLQIETANSKAGDIAPSLAGRGGPVREFVVVRVSDTGVGIPTEAMRRIFEPFFTTKEHVRVLLAGHSSATPGRRA
jgi:signal transduction histidine kinase